MTGETEISVSGFDITGELTGQKLFTGLFLLNSEFELDDGIEEVPNLTATNIAIVFVYLGRAQGYAITTIEGVPYAVYEVVGQKQKLLRL